MKENKKPLVKKRAKTSSAPPCKVAVIVSPGYANWASCHTISSNLRKAYEIAESKMGKGAQFDYIKYGESLERRELEILARKILKKKYTCISFIDHWPTAFGLVGALFVVSKGKNLPAFLMHIYGDFTFVATDMVSTFYLLRGHKVRPICASHRQINLVNALLKAPKGSIGYCPFPVNTKIYYPSATIRSEERRSLGWADDEFVMLYTGRVSMQKNVTLAISKFFDHLQKSGLKNGKKKFRFVFAGKYDDLGAPFFGNCPPKGEYFFRIRKIIEGIDPALGAVSYIGNLEAEKLNRVYNAADAFMSLSLHHDEDYGMSPAEALACGLPCILSDWGGYSSFALANSPTQKQVWLVPVGVDEFGHFLSEASLNDAITSMISHPRSAQERLEDGERFKKLFSIEAAAEKISEALAAVETSSVTSIKPALVQLAKRSIAYREKRSNKIYKTYSDSLYLKVYSGYYGLE